MLTRTWVVVSGIDPDDVLDVREFLDLRVGRTVSHAVVPIRATSLRGGGVYVQFASPIHAAQATQAGTYFFEVTCGTAMRRWAAAAEAPGAVTAASSRIRSVQLLLSWCEDDMFLQERAAQKKLRSQQTATGYATPRDGLAFPSSTTPPSSTTTSSGREDRHGTPAADVDDGSGSSSHPLLPRRSYHGMLSPSTKLPSTSRDGGTAKTADSVAGANGDFVDLSQYHRIPILSLFFNPCSFSTGWAWLFLYIYAPLRLVVILGWTLVNFLASLMPRQTWTDTSRSSQPQHLQSLSRQRRRRTMEMADAVPAATSPLDYLAFYCYKYLPLSPQPEEVDLFLWSWLSQQNPYPQQSLMRLRQRLVEERGLNGPGFYHAVSSRESFSDGVRRTDGIEEDPGTVYRPLPVLMTWRPSWRWMNYSFYSFLFVVYLMYLLQR